MTKPRTLPDNRSAALRGFRNELEVQRPGRPVAESQPDSGIKSRTLRYQSRTLIRLLLSSVQSSCDVDSSRHSEIDATMSGTAQKLRSRV